MSVQEDMLARNEPPAPFAPGKSTVTRRDRVVWLSKTPDMPAWRTFGPGIGEERTSRADLRGDAAASGPQTGRYAGLADLWRRKCGRAWEQDSSRATAGARVPPAGIVLRSPKLRGGEDARTTDPGPGCRGRPG